MKIVQDNKKKSVVIIFFLMLLDLFIVMGSTLNPSSKIVPSIDSSVYIYMGQRMREGAVPYRDVFDHKGPLLYAIEWLGLTIGKGSKSGIWVVELISMLVFLLFMYKSIKLFMTTDVSALVAVTFGSEILVESFGGGNFTEEYALPFIAYSLYVFLSYVKNDKMHKASVVVAGGCCGCVIMLRPNMISAWLAWAVVVVIMIFCDHNKKIYERLVSILKLIGLFIIGVLIAVIPFIGYYAAKDSLKIMIDTYIGTNMLYVGNNPYSISSIASVLRTYSHMMVLTTYTLLFYVVIVICMSYHNNCRNQMLIIWGNVFYIVLTLYLISISGRNYSHYLMVLTPCVMLSIAYILTFFRERVVSNVSGKYCLFILCVITVLFYLGPIKSQISTIRDYMVSRPDDDKLISEINQYAAPGEEVYVMDNRVSFLVETQTYTSFRYEFSPDFIDVSSDAVEYLEKDNPKVIVKLRHYEDGTKAKYDIVDQCADKMSKDGIYTKKQNDYAILYIRN